MSAYRNESSVRLSYVLEEADVEEQSKAPREEMIHLGRLAIGATVALSGIVFVATLPAATALGALVFAGCFGLWYGAKLKAQRPLLERYGRSWEDRRHVEVEISEELFRLADRVSETRLAWDLILCWRETQYAFLIFTGPTASHAILKRAFSSPEQETTLRQLLTDRVAPGGEKVVEAAKRAVWMPVVLFHAAATLVIVSVIEAFAHAVR